MEQRERDESSSKLEEALRELTGAETTGKIEEYENEREGADVASGGDRGRGDCPDPASAGD